MHDALKNIYMYLGNRDMRSAIWLIVRKEGQLCIRGSSSMKNSLFCFTSKYFQLTDAPFFFIEMLFCWDERKIIIPMLDKNKIVR